MDVEALLGSVGTLFAILILLLFLYAMIVLLARVLHRVMPATSPARDPAIDALRVRFASGEIDEIEYERLRAALQRH